MSEFSEIYPIDGVTIREMRLRDGLQIVKSWPDTQQKSEWAIAASKAGTQHYELRSFLPEKHFPQFADVNDLTEFDNGLDGVRSSALILNERGAVHALFTTVNELACLVSATEEHSQANMLRSREQEIDQEASLLVREKPKAAMPKENFHGDLYKARKPKNMHWRAA